MSAPNDNYAKCHCWCCERGKCLLGAEDCKPEECGKTCCLCVMCDGKTEVPYDHNNVTVCYCKKQ